MKGVIEVKNLSEPLFVLDDISKFETSLFRTVYEKAGVLLGNIISKKQEEIEKREKTDVRSTVENIISFQGRRGTGKTSAMLSVHDALKKYNNREDHQHFWGFSEKNREGRDEPEWGIWDSRAGLCGRECIYKGCENYTELYGRGEQDGVEEVLGQVLKSSFLRIWIYKRNVMHYNNYVEFLCKSGGKLCNVRKSWKSLP